MAFVLDHNRLPTTIVNLGKCRSVKYQYRHMINYEFPDNIFQQTKKNSIVSITNHICMIVDNIFCIQQNGTFTNSEDTDEMQHNAAFHQGLHWLIN